MVLKPFSPCLLLSLATYISTASAATSLPPGVVATGTNGPTNPPEPTLGTPINQTSMARLISVNAVDDFCLYAPPTLSDIGDSETIEVAWCTKPRNNARVIPDGVVQGVSLLKTDFYVQLIGYGDFTKLNIKYGDYGGELDPHGAYGSGNPIGGNVTSNITGSDIFYAEWMMYIDYNQFCFRVCTNANSTYSAADMCWHELDEVGCQYVMPGNYQVNNTFETCDADVAYPPGWTPTATVSGKTLFSTFAQRYTGTLSGGSLYTIGDSVTPSAAYFTPKSSNCVTTSTISNGVPLAPLGISSGVLSSRTGSLSPSATGSSGGSSSQSSAARKYDGGLEIMIVTAWALLAGIGAVVLLA
jgi:hypothetical protein